MRKKEVLEALEYEKVKRKPPKVVSTPKKEPSATQSKEGGEHQEEMDEANYLYGLIMKAQITKNWIPTNKKYIKEHPNLTILVGIMVDAKGNLLLAKINESCGNEILDESLLNAVRRSVPFPEPSEKIKDQVHEIDFVFSYDFSEILRSQEEGSVREDD